jgi:hypothetical protein
MRSCKETPTAAGARIDRRTVARLGAVAAAVGAGSVVLKPGTAAATTGAMQFGAENDAASDGTGLSSANGDDTLHVRNSANAPAISARSGGAGVLAFGAADGGVFGVTTGAGPGVRAQADVGTGPALRAEIVDAAATATAIDAAQAGQGNGVFAHIENSTSSAHAVVASTRGFGQALLAQVVNGASKTVALRAQTTGFGAAVEAGSALGVGGRFAGKVAPINLVPSALASHPATGSAGDLFVDRSKRLWFCKGGSSWHQLA